MTLSSEIIKGLFERATVSVTIPLFNHDVLFACKNKISGVAVFRNYEVIVIKDDIAHEVLAILK